MKYYVISGEASGDMHGARLMKEIAKGDDSALFRCWGGEKMQAAGGEIVKHYRDLAFMGFVEVLLNIRTITKNIRFCKEDILGWKPDVLILVDYPGFNMRIARFAHEMGIKVIYYISPQVWAWKKGRIHSIHRDTDLAFVVLPFEKAFHASHGYSVEFAGHPLLDTINDFRPDPDFRKALGIDDRPVVAVLPGSRKQEISRILPIMLSVVDDFPDYQFLIAGVKSLDAEFYHPFTKNGKTRVITGHTYDLLATSSAAIVTSGTATLETGLLGIPQVVCYRMTFFTALLAWMLVKVEHISLVNLVLGRRAVTELIQYKFTHRSLRRELDLLLNDPATIHRMSQDYKELKIKLGDSGASARAAGMIREKLKSLT